MQKTTNYLDSLLSMLAVAFIAMRVMEEIDWHWIWVLAPIWGYIIYICIISSLQGWYEKRMMDSINQKRDALIGKARQ